MGPEHRQENGNGKKAALWIQLFGPIGVLAGVLVHMGGTVSRIEASISELRVSQQRIISSVEPDIQDGIRREIRVLSLEKRVDSCCPYYGRTNR